MKETKIISDKFIDLSSYITRERDSYSNANPYPHIVIKDFFNEDFLNEILKSFPDISKVNSSEQWKNKNEVKFGNNDYSSFPNNIKLFFDFLNSKNFLQFLHLTEIFYTTSGCDGCDKYEV